MPFTETEEQRKKVWAYFNSVLIGWEVVWGNQNAPAPAAPYCALFYTGVDGKFYDSNEQGAAAEALRTGERSARVEARFVGLGALDAAGAIYDTTRAAGAYNFAAAGFSVNSCTAPTERTALQENGKDYIQAAALKMVVSYGIERTIESEYIEESITRGALNYSASGGEINIIIGG